jgi:hypothetical protein
LVIEVCTLIEEAFLIKDAKAKSTNKSHDIQKSSQDSKDNSTTSSQKYAVISKCNYCQIQG